MDSVVNLRRMSMQVSSAGHGAVFLYGGVNKFKNMYAEGKLEGIKFNIERKKNVLQVN